MHGQSLITLILMVFVAVTCIVIGDTAGKLMTSGGVDPGLVAWSRFLIAALVLLPFSGLHVTELPLLFGWRVALRAFVIAGGIFCILTALKTEPIANVFGAFFVGPVVSYVLAIVFLRERPSRARTLLLGLGFLGVMLVVKPGFGVSRGMMFALTAGVSYGAYLTLTRAVAGGYRPRFLLISQLVIGAVILTPVGVSAEMPAVSPGLGGLILISAFGSAAGNFLLVIANKRAEASLVAPLVYTQLISATVMGVVVFGDWPDALSFLGLGLIAASGVGTLLVTHKRAAP